MTRPFYLCLIAVTVIVLFISYKPSKAQGLPDHCTPISVIVQGATGNGWRVVPMGDYMFQAFMAEMIRRHGPPPSGIIPDGAIVTVHPAGVRTIIFLTIGDMSCDSITKDGDVRGMLIGVNV